MFIGVSDLIETLGESLAGNLGLTFCLDKTPSFFAKKNWHKIKTGSTLDYIRS